MNEPLGIHDPQEIPRSPEHTRSEGVEVYRVGKGLYKRPVKIVRRTDGTLFHVTPIGLEPGLSLAYYEIIETGAVFTACINASSLRAQVAESPFLRRDR